MLTEYINLEKALEYMYKLMSYYPNVLFFRAEELSDIDTFINDNKTKFKCTLNITSDTNDLYKLFNPNYHVLVTYGEKSYQIVGPIIHSFNSNRFNRKWIHKNDITDINQFNYNINYCYISTVIDKREHFRPKYSIFTTCYKSYDYIDAAYNSIKKQSLRDWEWVILDDTPEDEHFNVLRKKLGSDFRVRLYKRDKNSGNIGNVKNEVISLCRGKYVLEMDHDDEILPNCLSDAYKIFESDEKIGFVYGDTIIVDRKYKPFLYGDFLCKGYSGYYCEKMSSGIWTHVYNTPNVNNITMHYNFTMPNHPRMWRRSVLMELENYSELLPICDDFEIMLKTFCSDYKVVKNNKAQYIQYMNDGGNNFSNIRNREINRISRDFLHPIFYKKYNVDQKMKEKGAFESNIYRKTSSMIWKRESKYKHKRLNSVINNDYDNQYCIVNEKIYDEAIKNLYKNPRNDFIFLSNELSLDEVKSVLEKLGYDRMKCYSRKDCTEEQLVRFFKFLYANDNCRHYIFEKKNVELVIREKNSIQIDKLENTSSKNTKNDIVLSDKIDVEPLTKKRIFLIHNNRKGGVNKYVQDITILYPDFEYIYLENKAMLGSFIFGNDMIFVQNFLNTDIKIQDVIDIVEKQNVKLVIAIHDFIWLCKDQYNYSYKIPNSYLDSNIEILPDVKHLWSKAHTIIMNSRFTYTIYSKYFNTSNFVLSSLPDYNIKSGIKNIPEIKDKINLGVFSPLCKYKGKRYIQYLKNKYKTENINFCVVGQNIPYYNEEGFFEHLRKYNINAFLMLNEWGETYSYLLTKILNSGLPLLYNNFGALKERVPYNMDHYVKVFDSEQNENNTDFDLLDTKFNEFIAYIQKNHGKTSQMLENLHIHCPYLYNKIFREECSNIDKNIQSNKILIYTGNNSILWNYSHMDKFSLGGSEKAVAYLSKEFPSHYEIYISGDVEEETSANVSYVHHAKLSSLLKENQFDTIIVSRFLSFFKKFPTFSCKQLYIWSHDSIGFIDEIWNSDIRERENISKILDTNNQLITGAVALTEWHKNHIIDMYPILKNKISVINNGIVPSLFKSNSVKTKNKFIWTSCSNRGLSILLNLWKEILAVLPDATLDICSYHGFPLSKEDHEMNKIILANPSIKYHGKLNTAKLYELMLISEYWLYTNTVNESSCITALEMLMSGVICLYYQNGGLKYTLGEYGIVVNTGNEIETLKNLKNEEIKNEEIKKNIIQKGRNYATTCSWSNKIKEWSKLLNMKLKIKWAFYHSNQFLSKMVKQYIYNLNNIYSDSIIYLTSDREKLLKENLDKITFIFDIFDKSLIDELPSVQFGFLNTEPLNNHVRLQALQKNLNIIESKKIEYFDYSKSNLKILEEKGILQNSVKTYLPYKPSSNEHNFLVNINKTTKKTYDFGILTASNGKNIERRKKVIDYLSDNGFSINIIHGWGEYRDLQLAQCKYILNIHGFWGVKSDIFEHIRCDRLLEAGFNILSETSYELDPIFVNKYPNLKQINYKDFFNVNLINNILNKKNICFIHSCNLKGKGLKRLEYLVKKIKDSGLIDHLETVYINNIGIPILENAYGDKFNISNYSENPALYEIPTINKILDFSKTVDCNILYLHTKGISYNDDDQKENDWIDMMLYFLVEKFELCLEKLQQGIQTIGCNYYDEKIKIRNPKCFGGNFWWADSQYISTLPSLIEKTENVNPNDAEFWLCKNNPSVYELHNSKINHYIDVYPPQNYQSHYIIINKLTRDYSSAWLGHMKFANWLVTLLNPSITVDLGVDHGHSTFSFASANKGIVYGIDSFEGDIQAGFRDTFDIVRNLNDDFITKNYYKTPITFIKGFFDDVYKNFNETIDILHIDGLHTIEAVSNDYNKWITKTSENAVILFHDVVSYPNSVGKVFNDIQYPKFYFTHSAGLGVVCKNIETLDKIYTAINLPNKEFIKIRDYRYDICCTKGQSSGLDLNKYVKNCIDNIGVTNIVNICDVGCGIGEHSKLLLSQYPNFKFTGVDWSQSTIDYLKQNTSFFDEIVHCKSSNLPFNNKQFSVALSMECLEHLYSNDCINAFKELKRISEYIIITIPRPEWIVNIPWLNKEILEATNDDIPLTLRDFISLESCVHKTGYYENSLINAGFIKCDIEHPYNGIYYCNSNDLDISKIQYTGIDSNNLLQTDNYKEKYIDLLDKSLNLKFIQNQPKIIDCIVNNNQIKIFVIHYKKLTDRKKSILTQFKKYNLTNYEFIEIDRDELDNYDTSLFHKNFKNSLTAISLSHFNAYKKIVECYDSALIFEDDVILSDNFMTKLAKYTDELPNDFDILCIGDGCNLHVNNTDLQPNKHIYKRQNKQDKYYLRCTDSYIVSKKCALFLCNYINTLKNINQPIDVWLNDIAVGNTLKTYWAEPTIVTQGSQNGLFDRSWFEEKNKLTSFIDFNKDLNKSTSSQILENLYELDHIKFYYGVNQKQLDITDIVIEKCMNNNKIVIPQGDNERAAIFTDPLYGVVKNIYIKKNNSYCLCDPKKYIYLDLNEPNNSYISESFNPEVLTCYMAPNKKQRLGKDYDGGYVICDIPNVSYNLLLSCGIGDDISFEEHFCDRFKSCPCYAYDGTIEGIGINNNNNIMVIKKNINNFNDDNNTNLHEVIEKYDNIFLKMDIEGWEIPWIETLNEKQINKFSQIVIEFHFPFSGKEVLAFNKLTKNHILVHFHSNNCCGVRLHKGVKIPNVFECTYLHKKYYNTTPKLNCISIPSKLDMRNVIAKEEINIDYEPFVFSKPKIIDCFTFYNEIEMLTYRLNVLDEIVDYFILVEATHTYIGKEKPLFYQENKHLFEKFNHKIIHVVVDDFPHKFPNIDISKDEQWINERFQRNCISRGLDKLSLQNDDVITITDLDEIPNPNILEKFKNNEISVDVNIIKMDFYYYNLNSKMDHDWFRAKVLTFKKYNELKIDCEKIRFYKCPIINNGGWHLSYFGNEKFIKNKIENFGHQEYNHNKFTNEELIIERVKSGKDLFDRAINIINMPIKNNDNLPPKYDIHLTNFYN